VLNVSFFATGTATDADRRARPHGTKNGVTQTARILPNDRGFTMETRSTRWKVSAIYLVLGIEHIRWESTSCFSSWRSMFRRKVR
jgi:hypothetical protein